MPAAVAASVMFVNVMPFSLSKKLNPWLMFLSALLVLFLPVYIDIALAMTVPMGLIYGWTGVRLQGHEPVRLPVNQVKSLATKLRENIRTPGPRENILTREFPSPSVEKYVPEL